MNANYQPAGDGAIPGDTESVLDEFLVKSEPGNERQAMDRVAEIIAPYGLSPERLERLKTAVAEATMNAIEHGHAYQPELPVQVQVKASPRQLRISVRNHSGGKVFSDPVTPDLEAKLAGLQSPRGWGFFLIRSMVDDLNVTDDPSYHTIELIFNLSN